MWRTIEGWEGEGRGREVRDELSVVEIGMGSSFLIFGGNCKDSDTLDLVSSRKSIDPPKGFYGNHGVRIRG